MSALKSKWVIPLFFALGLGLYGGGFNHAFQLDDAYAFVDNPWVRSLTHIPRYFIDPTTLTAYHPNADYRPVLQITYAVNYALSGTSQWSWHLTQILLHCALTSILFLFLVRLLGATRRGESFAASLLFLIHPTASGVVNYNWARLSLLSALFVGAALLRHLRALDEGQRGMGRGALGLFTLALFTKVEAIGALPLFAGLEVLRKGSEVSFLRWLGGSFRILLSRNYLPLWGTAGLYLGIRYAVMPETALQGRDRSAVPPFEYLLTQMTVGWHYLGRWFVPTALVADNASYPVVQSLWDPRLLLSVLGWSAVGGMVIRRWRQDPTAAFLVVAALCLLAPTSSLAPLAEMANEHRPYFPLALVSVLWVGPALRWAARQGAWGYGLGAFTLVVLGVLTWERNGVFQTEESYWKDVVMKAPSARAHNNYGRTLMARGNLEFAKVHFERAQELAPQWFIVQINLGLVQEALGRPDVARVHLDRAVELDLTASLGHQWRGDFFARQGQVEAALLDYRAGIERAGDPCAVERKMKRLTEDRAQLPSPSHCG